jgi:hypothetical protein
MKVTPIPYMSVESSMQVKRNVLCKHYDTCLDFTIEKDWPGFSCEECHGYERECMEREQWEEDRQRCISLIFCALFPNLKIHGCSTDTEIEWKEIGTARGLSADLEKIRMIGNQEAAARSSMYL